MAAVSKSASLAEIGLKTMKLFEQVKSIDNLDKSPAHDCPKALFIDEADRFELWAVNLGLFVSGHDSLDYRVREAESLECTLRRFMNDLNDSLSEVLDYYAEDGQSDGQKGYNSAGSYSDLLHKPSDEELDDMSDEAQESDIELLLDGVRDPIDRLYKLSTRIRNPSTRFWSSKVQLHQQIDEETGIDFLHVVEKFDLDYVSSLLKQYQPGNGLDARFAAQLSQINSYLVWRIAHANVKRRQQFSYWKKHRDELSRHLRTSTLHLEAHQDIPAQTIPVGPERLPNEDFTSMVIPPAHSITSASSLNPPQFNERDNCSTVSISEYTPSTSQSDEETIDFPPPPKQRPDAKYFECPYCFTLCSTKVLASKEWKAHLIHDLRPYICTNKECENPYQLYDTRQDWIQHENKHFKKWYIHDRRCPICFLHVGMMSSPHDHLARHLERFALFSLPRAVDDEDQSEDGGSDKANVAFESSRDGDFDYRLDIRGESDPRTSAAGVARQRWRMVLYEVRSKLIAERLKKAERERRDREADEAVRRAAEADAKKPAEPARKSWFGGWFGGKRDDSSSGGPIRAKLGEENSFYYDTNLKKWVNKKDFVESDDMPDNYLYD